MWRLIVSIPDLCPLSYSVDMNMFARFDETPTMTVQVFEGTKRYERTHALTDGRTENVKTVYPPQKHSLRGYNEESF